MNKLIKSTSVLLLTLFIGLFSIQPSFASEKDDIFLLTNQTRQSLSLPALKANASLDAVALAWSYRMSIEDTMYHNPSLTTQIPPGWRAAGENVAWSYGFENPVSNIYDGWIASPPHYANISYGEFTDIGIGVFTDDNGKTWATQVFAKYETPEPTPKPLTPPPTSSPPAPTPQPTPTVAPIDPVVQEIQQILQRLGYIEVGDADGVAGRLTQVSIQRFQQDAQYDITGQADDITLQQLRDKESQGWSRDSVVVTAPPTATSKPTTQPQRPRPVSSSSSRPTPSPSVSPTVTPSETPSSPEATTPSEESPRPVESDSSPTTNAPVDRAEPVLSDLNTYKGVIDVGMNNDSSDQKSSVIETIAYVVMVGSSLGIIAVLYYRFGWKKKYYRFGWKKKRA